jgi:hypothetical protein
MVLHQKASYCTINKAVAQAERWQSNPSVDFIQRWAEACGAKLRLELMSPSREQQGKQ